MNGDSSLVRRLAERLAAHTESIMPRDRAQWAQAMRRELDHVPGTAAALRWALGCVLASYIERMTTMSTDRVGISRWVLSLWMLCCFWWDAMVFVSLVGSAFVGVDARGPVPFNGELWLRTMGWVLGPIGLALAFKAIVLGRPALSQTTLAILGAAALATLAEAGVVLATSAHPLENWHEYVLLAVLPLLGAAHLVHIARPGITKPATA